MKRIFVVFGCYRFSWKWKDKQEWWWCQRVCKQWIMKFRFHLFWSEKSFQDCFEMCNACASAINLRLTVCLCRPLQRSMFGELNTSEIAYESFPDCHHRLDYRHDDREFPILTRWAFSLAAEMFVDHRDSVAHYVVLKCCFPY